MAKKKKPVSQKIQTKKQKPLAAKGTIVIGNENALEFANEEELFNHFKQDVEIFETEFLAKRPKTDFTDQESEKYFDCLDRLLDDPEEIWEDTKTLPGKTVHHYIGTYLEDGEEIHYVACAHVEQDSPTFIYLHFPTKFAKVADRYCRGELIYDRVIKDVEKGAIEGDSLSEGDGLAVGLYKAMLTVRSETDFTEDQFAQFADLREEAIEEADEIWRTHDFSGQVLVHFIKEVHGEEAADVEAAEGQDIFYYVVVTLEEEATNSHALLFSFPTRDASLVDRYRHGENLQAEEVVQEASH